MGRQGDGLPSALHRGVKVPATASSDSKPREAPSSVGSWPLLQQQFAVVDASALHARRRAATSHVAGASTMVQKAGLSAATMFADANATRRRGDLHGALSLYQALRRQFPETSEARLSAISMADALLDLGSPGLALDAYGVYLAENAGARFARRLSLVAPAAFVH